MASISVVDAAQEAVAHTKRHLLPVSPLKWLILGFLAFLDQCGRSANLGGPHGGGGHGTGFHPWNGPVGGREAFHEMAHAARMGFGWLQIHAGLILVAVAAGLIALSILLAVVLWINSKGTFLYLSAVASGKAEVVRPWHDWAQASWSYFGWRYVLSLGSVMIFVLVGGIATASVAAFLNGRIDSSMGGLTLLALIPMVLALLLAVPILCLALVLLRDFVAPLQMETGLSCGAAARLLETLVMAQPGAFVLYLLLKLLYVMVTSVVIALVGCLTCCIGFLPVVAQTLFQPFYFFERAWPLFLLRQMGHDLPGRLAARE